MHCERVSASIDANDATDFDVKRFFDLSLQAQEEWDKRASLPRHFDKFIEADRPIGIVETSDWHVGAPGTAHRRLRDDMLRIADHPRLYADVGGDGINNFIAGRLVLAGVSDTFAAGDQQLEIVRYIFTPLAESGSALSIRPGNHDGWVSIANLDPLWHVWRDVPHLHSLDGSIMRVHLGDQEYKFFRRHRHRWSSVFNPAHSVVMEYQRGQWEWDVGVIEHQHMSHGADFDGKERADGSTRRIAIRPGTYKLADEYANERGYYGSSSVLQTVILWPGRFEMLRVPGLDLAIEILDRL